MSEHGIVLSLASTNQKIKKLMLTVGLHTKKVFTKKWSKVRRVFMERTRQNFSKISSEHLRFIVLMV